MKKPIATFLALFIATSAHAGAKDVEYMPTAQLKDLQGAREIFLEILARDIKRYPGHIQRYWLTHTSECRVNGRKYNSNGTFKGSISCTSENARELNYIVINGTFRKVRSIGKDTCTPFRRVSSKAVDTFTITCEDATMTGTLVLGQ